MAVIIDPTKLDPKINGIAYQHPSQQCKENRTWTITDANIESQVGESNDCESLSDRCGGDDKDFMKLLAGVVRLQCLTGPRYFEPLSKRH